MAGFCVWLFSCKNNFDCATLVAIQKALYNVPKFGTLSCRSDKRVHDHTCNLLCILVSIARTLTENRELDPDLMMFYAQSTSKGHHSYQGRKQTVLLSTRVKFWFTLFWPISLLITSDTLYENWVLRAEMIKSVCTQLLMINTLVEPMAGLLFDCCYQSLQP